MREPPPCRVKEAPLGDRAHLVEVEGELDFTTVGRLDRVLDATAGVDRPAVVVDLSGLAFIDSSGIAALIRARRKLLEAGRRLLLVRSQEDPLRLLQMKGIEQLLEICSTRDEALSRAAES